MSNTNNNKTKWLHLRLSPKEHEQLLAAFDKTTTRKLSDYARKILLGKPVIASYRNRSMDDFMTELVRLRMELNSIGNNFNQLVKKLHTAQQTEVIAALLKVYEKDKTKLLDHIAAIQLFIEKNERQW